MRICARCQNRELVHDLELRRLFPVYGACERFVAFEVVVIEGGRQRD